MGVKLFLVTKLLGRETMVYFGQGFYLANEWRLMSRFGGRIVVCQHNSALFVDAEEQYSTDQEESQYDENTHALTAAQLGGESQK